MPLLPSNKGPFMDAQERARLQRWIAEKWKPKACPVCLASAWSFNEKVGQIYNDNTLSDGTAFPVVLIFCTNCGYTIPINARIAGVRTDEPAAESANVAQSSE